MQKEQLSALMDGEALNSEVSDTLLQDVALQKSWESYHLIRDTLRGDISEVIHFNIAARVAAAVELEPAKSATPFISVEQPAPERWENMPFWQHVRPWAMQITQVGVAACVSLAVIVGFQHYNRSAQPGSGTESPVLNTLPVMGQASPVSYGVPQNAATGPQQVQEQRRRVNALLQDYELQRRLYAEQLQIEQSPAQQAAAVQVSGNQSSGMQR